MSMTLQIPQLFDTCLFADDTSLFHSFDSHDIIDLQQVNEQLKHIVDWCNTNKLTINTKKTEYIIFRGKSTPVCSVGSICIKGEHIAEAESTMFIGTSCAE